MVFLRSIVAVAVAAAIAILPQSASAQESALPGNAATATFTKARALSRYPRPTRPPSSVSAKSIAAASDSIPAGTTITMQNPQTYRDIVPDGRPAFFEGKYFLEDADGRSDAGRSHNYSFFAHQLHERD